MNHVFRRVFLLSLPLSLLAFPVLLGGCGDQPAAEQPAEPSDDAAESGGGLPIAIVNLDTVSQELGLTQQLVQILGTRRQQLQEQVVQVQMRIQADFEEKLQQFGEELSDEQQTELQQIRIRNTQLLNNVQAEAQQQAAQLQNYLIDQVRTKLKSPIDKVARRRGVSLVLTDRPDMIVFTADGIDITREVISLARDEGINRIDVEGLSLPANGQTPPGDGTPAVTPGETLTPDLGGDITLPESE